MSNLSSPSPGAEGPSGRPCPREGREGASAAAEGATPRIASQDLFRAGRRIIIEHAGREYSLLITRQGKLVLNRC